MPVFTAALGTVTKNRKQFSVHQPMTGRAKCGIDVQ